jgi:hypothetical protein
MGSDSLVCLIPHSISHLSLIAPLISRILIHNNSLSMEIQISPESRAALLAASPVRCLYKERLLCDSRQPQPVKAWAAKLVETVYSTVLQSVGRDPTVSSKELLMVRIQRRHILICFDIFWGIVTGRADGTAIIVTRPRFTKSLPPTQYTQYSGMSH